MITPAGQPDATPLAVVAGVRTPFAKAFGALAEKPADVLGQAAVSAVLGRAEMTTNEIDEVVFGNVAGQPEASNVARVVATRAGIPVDRIAHTVNRNCASGMESVFQAWHAIREGRSEVVVAGGTESMSNVPLLWDRRMKDLLVAWNRRRRIWDKVKLLTRIRPGYFRPVAALQLGLTDVTCGLSMGETAELLAREFSISREEQDRFALGSHQRAVAAWERGFFDGEVAPLRSEKGGSVDLARDTGPRPSQTLESLGRLRPVFDREGTVTVGNSCPITDGAAAMVLTSASRAADLGCEPLGYVRGYALAGCDPRRMGLGPVFAVSKLLEKTGLSLEEFDLVEINEAFAAQVLSCLKAAASDTFARETLGRQQALGEIDPERINVNGGAISLGHPVGTSGTRLIITLLRALGEKGLRHGLATLCVGGGQGTAVWVQATLD